MNANSSDVLLTDLENGICTLTLNRPDTMNALSGELVQRLKESCERLRYDNDVRVIILTGAGDRAFCAGADLKERQTMSEDAVIKRLDEYRECFEALSTLPKPVICAINGFAFGGGLELALACDIRLVNESTQVGLTELRLGIIPGAGGTQRLARLIGPARAKELIFSAARITGKRAEELGIVNEAVAGPQLMTRALELAGQMLLSAPIALKQAKLAIDNGLQVDLSTGLQLESIAYAVTIPTEDRQEGLAAFREKRRPNFQGK